MGLQNRRKVYTILQRFSLFSIVSETSEFEFLANMIIL